jgi:diguanylate cyclase (GGDEF)-like protein
VKDRDVELYRQAAATDHLTGVLNRRAFLDAATQLSARRSLRGEPVSLMMFDLDHFKSINDRFGHAVGDAALRLFAQVLRGSMRTNDIVARLGGEEFAAIVPGDRYVAELIGERVRAAFETAARTIEDHAIAGTVSIGAATELAPVPNLAQLLEHADMALYEAKRSGRNRMCIWNARQPAAPPAGGAVRAQAMPRISKVACAVSPVSVSSSRC